MDLETIRLLYGYERWVNRRLLATVEEVPPEQLREGYGVSFDTIHGTLAHILGAQIAWLSRWQGVSPTRLIGAGDFESLEAIEARWEQHERELDAFLAELTPERLAAPVLYTRPTGESYQLPLWQLMLHAVNHGTHHRSELADMLTRVGHAPQPTDLVRYSLERTGQA